MPHRFSTIDMQHQEPAAHVMAERHCPVCGSERDRLIFALEDFQFFCDEPGVSRRTDIHQVICRDCFTLYMNPAYTTVGFALLFDQAANSYGATVIRKDEQLAWLNARDLLQQDQTLLDVGCYRGAFIESLPDHVNCIGVDIDNGVIEEATQRLGNDRRKFVAANFEALEFDDHVDLITMFHVLEHLPRPQLVLKKLRALGNDQTRLVVEVPILELAKTNDINGYLTVSHLTHFSKTTLKMCMARAGWRIVDETMQPDYNGYRILAEKDESVEYKPSIKDLSIYYDYQSHHHESLHNAEVRIAEVPTSHSRVIWGAGFHTELLFHLTSLFDGTQRCLVVDKDERKQGKTWRGLSITSPDVLHALDWRSTSLIVSSYGFQDAIVEEALSLGVPEDRIITLYDHLRRY